MLESPLNLISLIEPTFGLLRSIIEVLNPVTPAVTGGKDFTNITRLSS